MSHVEIIAERLCEMAIVRNQNVQVVRQFMPSGYIKINNHSIFPPRMIYVDNNGVNFPVGGALVEFKDPEFFVKSLHLLTCSWYDLKDV